MPSSTSDPNDLPADMPSQPLARANWFGPRARLLAVVLLVLALVGWLTVPRLPSGICFDDSGDLQLVSATLGIAHPPGYPGYATIGFLLTRIPGVDPAYIVSVACMVTGLLALAACFLMQVQLGAGVWISAAITMALAAHPRFWTNLRAPEVYMPTLALVSWSAYLLIRYSKSGLRRHLFWAVLLFGVALGNRPPVLFAAPFFLVAWVFARPRRTANEESGPATRRAWWRDLVWMIPLSIAPTLYSLGYIFVRDRPDVCYNYIDNHNEEENVLPESSDGLQARIRRTIWQISGEQFSEYMGTTWRQLAGKLRWLQTQVAHGTPFVDVFVFFALLLGFEPPPGTWYPQVDVLVLSLLALLGLIIAWRRSRVGGTLLLGLALYCIVFVLAYGVFAQAADLLPLLFAEAVCVGVVGSKVFPHGGHWIRQLLAAGLALGAAFLLAAELPRRPDNSTGVDASAYLKELDMATFPGPAVLCANWTKSVPMRYSQCVLTGRTDLHLVTSGPELWLNLGRRIKDRPVYVADPLDTQGECTLEPFRNVFLMKCGDAKQINPAR